jgi:hypothetical protein
MKIPWQFPGAPVDAIIFLGRWRRLCQITLFVFVSLAVPSVLAAEVLVQLRSEATVKGDVYQMEDIAAIIGDQGTADHPLAESEIGVAPSSGQSGSALATVRAADGVAGKLRLMTLAEEFLRSQLRGNYEKLKIRVVEEVGEITMPPGAWIRSRIPGGIISRRTVVWLEIGADGHPQRVVPVWFSVEAWKQVPVAQADLPAGSELRSGDFALELRDVAQTPGVLDRLPAVGRSRAVACSRLRIAIESGAPLTADSLELAPSTICNPSIALNGATNKVTTETAQVAHRSGRIGEMMKVGTPRDDEIYLPKKTTYDF